MSLILIVAVLLVLVILAQNAKGGGLSSQFGGSGASNMIGVKKTTDLLERITWGLAISMVALTLSTSFLTENQKGPARDEIIDKAQQELPGFSPEFPGGLEGGEDTEGGSGEELELVPEEE